MIKKYKILGADDDLDILEIIKFNLERNGFDVTVTNKSTETYELALKIKPGIAIRVVPTKIDLIWSFLCPVELR